MIRSRLRHVQTTRMRRQALGVLLSFVAAVCVMVAAPFVHASALERVCSVHGDRFVATGASTTVESHDEGGHHPDGDHAAHCPLCMPVGAPPVAWSLDFDAVQPLAHVRQSIPAARLASLVGAPLPARGPPTAS